MTRLQQLDGIITAFKEAEKDEYEIIKMTTQVRDLMVSLLIGIKEGFEQLKKDEEDSCPNELIKGLPTTEKEKYWDRAGYWNGILHSIRTLGFDDEV